MAKLYYANQCPGLSVNCKQLRFKSKSVTNDMRNTLQNKEKIPMHIFHIFEQSLQLVMPEWFGHP